jgi:4,5-dihydroxyphthalate decarboxylase
MLEISLAVMYSDRTAALFDGRVPIEGCNVHTVLLRPGEIFHRIFKFEEFDVAEMSLSSHLLTTARGDSKYVGIPAFPLRLFRHSGIYIRNDRGINRPQDLRGKTVGLPEFQQTANVWIRGMLQDQHGVDMASVHWRTGGLEEPGREERADIRLLKDIDWQIIPRDRTLSEMLEAGELDAVISPRPPPCFIRRDKCKSVDQLFPDYPAIELEYFKKTKIFPIMHVVGIRRSLVEQHPWLPVSVFKAFLDAKTLIDLRNGSILPWGHAEYRRMQYLLGDDYWSYHLRPNHHLIGTFARYAVEQGLVDRMVAPEELFAPSTLNLAKA